MASPALKAPLGSGAYLTAEGSASFPSGSPHSLSRSPSPLDITVWKGGSLFEVSRRSKVSPLSDFTEGLPPPDLLSGGDLGSSLVPPVPPRGGPRGSILFLSSASRRRLKADLHRVLSSSPFIFASLTMPGLPDNWSPDFFAFGPPRPLPGPDESRTLLFTWGKRMERRWPSFSAHWKLEPQERGVPHFHLCIYGVDYTQENMAFMRDAWHEIAGRGHSAHLAYGFVADHVEGGSTKARDYLAKYVSKDGALTLNHDVGRFASSSPSVGRFWGVINRQAIPYATPLPLQIPPDLVYVVLRILKRLDRSNHRAAYAAQCERLLKREFSHVFGSDASFPDPVKSFHALKSSSDLQRKRASGLVRFPRLFNPFRRVSFLRNHFTPNPARTLSDVFRAGSIWMREFKPPPWGNRPPPLAGPVGRLP